ncbi:hypothetical protein CDAR_403991 [Caerostris darwini]|uniref:Uncharacterized protein n=1 Tax=Caerostris darwini TaxID=1538125 RepID=A0AAV4SR66_9ARAC|nr:hypothetical protein CDAR_403991 [Caerostris darwini]
MARLWSWPQAVMAKLWSWPQAVMAKLWSWPQAVMAKLWSWPQDVMASLLWLDRALLIIRLMPSHRASTYNNAYKLGISHLSELFWEHMKLNVAIQ